MKLPIHNVHEKTTLGMLRRLKEYDVLIELQFWNWLVQVLAGI